MTSPYQILGVAEQASDAEIKLAYLEQIKACPPDRDQNRFQQIQTAYESIRDLDSRLQHALFTLPEANFNALLDRAFKQESAFQAMPADDFLKLLNAVPIEKSLLNAFTRKPS